MKKLLAFTLALTVMFGCACSSAAKPSGDRPGPVSDADDTDVVVEDIHFDYPDQIVTKPGGTAGMTVYKCGILYYACVDGNNSWTDLYNSLPIELEEGTLPRLLVPALLGRTGYEKRESLMLLVRGKGLSVGLGVPAVDRAVLEQLHRLDLAVLVVGNDLKAVEYEGLPHYVEVGAQGVDHLHAPFLRERRKPLVICTLRQGIVHRLDEAVGSQEIGYPVTYCLRFGGRSGIDRHLHVRRKVDVVVAVDPEDLLDHVALPRHIDHVGRSRDQGAPLPFLDEVIAQVTEYLLYRVVSDLLADELLDAVVVEVDDLLPDLYGIELLHAADNLASGKGADEKGCALAGIFTDCRVGSPLEPERSVCLESVALGGLAD